MTYKEFLEMLNIRKLRPGAIKELNIAAESITADKIKAGAITADEIEAGSITADKLVFNPYIIGTHDLDDVIDGDSYSKILKSAISNGLVLLSQAVGSLDNIGDGTTYKKVLSTDISAGHILLSACIGSIDNIANGSTYGKVLITDIQAGHILLASCVGNLDSIANGSTYGKILLTDIQAGHILLSECTGDLDDIIDGTTYGKVLKADISAGHILLSACSGNLDNITNGSTYGKVALTGISAGKIIVAGLDSGVTARMFLDAATKTNIEAWRHASDVTLIDGGDIYANSITADKINVSSLSAIKANMGTLTAGKIDVGSIEINADTERILMGAATNPATGKGVFIGKDGSDYEFRCGNPAGHWMHWEGTTVRFYQSPTVYVTVSELQAGAYRALTYIQGSPYEGGYQGMLMCDETAFYWGGGPGTHKYKISLEPKGSGNIYYLIIDTDVQGGGAGSGESPPAGDPEMEPPV